MSAYHLHALALTRTYAESRQASAKATIEHVLSMSDISAKDWKACRELIREKACIGLHFHPYRLNEDGVSVLALLLQDGKYKNQFETQISNGSLTAFPGGKRDQWENQLFDKLYEKTEIPFSHRPKYGALQLLAQSDGPCPRFGSCYFILKPSLSAYSTFTYGDSYLLPAEKGTLKAFDGILAAMMSDSFEREAALGHIHLRPEAMVNNLTRMLKASVRDRIFYLPRRNLDHYIEAQVHKDILLEEDVAALVADAHFMDTPYQGLLEELSQRYGFPLYWHPGFELKAEEVPKNFRGKHMPAVAERIAIAGKVHAYALAEAEKSRFHRPNEPWPSLQQLKYLWHTLVRTGTWSPEVWEMQKEAGK
ncbi:MAG: DUF3626 domain-containing protein [Bacteroidota bacterium]